MNLITISKSIIVLLAILVSFSGCKDDDEIFTEVKSFTGDVIITTRVELDTFTAERYGVIVGNLTLEGELYSLNGLIDLTKITGDLSILNTNLATLDGLNNLNEVAGSLIVQENADLNNFCSLISLFFVNQGLIADISNNAHNPQTPITENNCSL